jgi:hypothetical protein
VGADLATSDLSTQSLNTEVRSSLLSGQLHPAEQLDGVVLVEFATALETAELELLRAVFMHAD